MSTAAAVVAGSTPYSWIERTGSPGSGLTMFTVSALPSTRARAVVISHTHSPAGANAPGGWERPAGSTPPREPLSASSRHSRRKGGFVTGSAVGFTGFENEGGLAVEAYVFGDGLGAA